MGEVIGLLASGISIGTLVVQIGSSIARIKRFLNQVKEAPEEIRSLIEEIEDLYCLLEDIQDDGTRNPISSKLLDETSATRCREHCKKGADRLKELVDELGSDIDTGSVLKRKFAAVKVVLNREKIERYRMKLARAVRLLSLAHQCYTRALVRLQPEIIVARLQSVLTLSQQPSFTSEFFAGSEKQENEEKNLVENPSQTKCTMASHQDCMHTPSSLEKIFGFAHYRYSELTTTLSCKWKAHSKAQIIAQYRAPTWFTNRSWDLYGHKAKCGWKFHFQHYNIVPEDSPVFRCARNGDIDGLRDLFLNREASVFDRDIDGLTPLHLAARGRNLSTCQFLLDEGANAGVLAFPNDQLRESKDYWSPLVALLQWDKRYHVTKHLPITELILRMLPANEETLFYNEQNFSSLGLSLNIPDEDFDVLENQLVESLKWVSEELRVEAVINLLRCSRGSFFEKVIGSKPLSVSYYTATNLRDWTLLHYAFCGAAWTICRADQNITECDIGRLSLLQNLIAECPDLHTTETRRSMSPFCWSLNWLIWRTKRNQASFTRCLRKLLQWLVQAGIDLEVFGLEEKKIVQSTQHLWKYFNKYSTRPLILTFTFGPHPDDWIVWEEEVTDRFVGEFWSLTEHEDAEIIIPGGWVD